MVRLIFRCVSFSCACWLIFIFIIVFRSSRDSATWTQQSKLVAGDGSAQEMFGSAVAINANGTLVVVGAPDDNIVGTGTSCCLVYFSYTVVFKYVPFRQRSCVRFH